jgi:alanine-glyoxylate transaminase/serine-glyoxylate transaminase/serine-pyruvate transaminase
MIEEEGLEAVWARHAVLADVIHAAVDAWAAPGGLELNIPDPSARSHAVTTILAGTVDPDRLRATCQQQAGLTLGVGLGPFEGRAFRIGHMGHLNPPMVLGTLGTIEAALLAAGAPMGGSGVAAAAATAGRAFATAGG